MSSSLENNLNVIRTKYTLSQSKEIDPSFLNDGRYEFDSEGFVETIDLCGIFVPYVQDGKTFIGLLKAGTESEVKSILTDSELINHGFYIGNSKKLGRINYSFRNIIDYTKNYLLIDTNDQGLLWAVIYADYPKMAYLYSDSKETDDPSTTIIDAPLRPSDDFCSFFSAFSPVGEISEIIIGNTLSATIYAYDTPTDTTSPYYTFTAGSVLTQIRYELSDTNYPRQSNQKPKRALCEVNVINTNTITSFNNIYTAQPLEFVAIRGNAQTHLISSGVFTKDRLPDIIKFFQNTKLNFTSTPSFSIGYISSEQSPQELVSFMIELFASLKKYNLNETEMIMNKIRLHGNRTPIVDLKSFPTWYDMLKDDTTPLALKKVKLINFIRKSSIKTIQDQ